MTRNFIVFLSRQSWRQVIFDIDGAGKGRFVQRKIVQPQVARLSIQRKDFRKILDDVVALFFRDSCRIYLRNARVSAGSIHVKHAAHGGSPSILFPAADSVPGDVLETMAPHAIIHEVVARRAGRIQRVEVDQFRPQFIRPDFQRHVGGFCLSGL